MTTTTKAAGEGDSPKKRRRYVPAVGPGLKKLLAVVFALFALLTVNAVYLVSITVAGVEYQNWFYLIMFGVHLVLGLAIVVPVVVFGHRHRLDERQLHEGGRYINSGAWVNTGPGSNHAHVTVIRGEDGQVEAKLRRGRDFLGAAVESESEPES